LRTSRSPPLRPLNQVFTSSVCVGPQRTPPATITGWCKNSKRHRAGRSWRRRARSLQRQLLAPWWRAVALLASCGEEAPELAAPGALAACAPDGPGVAAVRREGRMAHGAPGRAIEAAQVGLHRGQIDLSLRGAQGGQPIVTSEEAQRAHRLHGGQDAD